MQGRLGDARKILDKTSDSLEESKLRLANIKEVIGIPEHYNNDVFDVKKRNQGHDMWKELLFHPTLVIHHILISAVGLHFFQQGSSIDVIVLYNTRIFEKVGITNSDKKLLCTIFIRTIFVMVMKFMLYRIGGRPLLLTSVAGMVVSLSFYPQKAKLNISELSANDWGGNETKFDKKSIDGQV
ncbi:hypothetical protein CerSpe_207890 [Prunus speciosa]